MVRATTRRALGRVLRRSELLVGSICWASPLELPTLRNIYREENNEAGTRWNRFELAPKRHIDKRNIKKSRSRRMDDKPSLLSSRFLGRNAPAKHKPDYGKLKLTLKIILFLKYQAAGIISCGL